MYDLHGMAAFDKTHGGMPEYTDINDIFGQMFGMEGDLPPGFGGSVPRKPRKGPDEVKEWKVSLEEFYKGRTVKLACERKTLCERCKGSGGKEHAKPKKCSSCHGQGEFDHNLSGHSKLKMMFQGFKMVPQRVGPRLMQPMMVQCNVCSGNRTYFSDKDKCKKCKGQKVVVGSKVFELYIPRGWRYVLPRRCT